MQVWRDERDRGDEQLDKVARDRRQHAPTYGLAVTFGDPGDQDRGRVKRRGMPAARNALQDDLFSGRSTAPANVGPATKAFHPETSRSAARRAGELATEKQLAVLALFHIYGHLNDEDLVNVYRRKQRALGDVGKLALLPMQTDSGIRSRRAELVELRYLEYAGYKTIMSTNGEGRVHRVKDGAPEPDVLAHLRATT